MMLAIHATSIQQTTTWIVVPTMPSYEGLKKEHATKSLLYHSVLLLATNASTKKDRPERLWRQVYNS